MKKMLFKALGKTLFGAKYERLTRALIVELIVFWGLYTTQFTVQIAPFILYIMVSTSTAGVMWQALSSQDNTANLKNLFMLPFTARNFVFSYIVVLGVYTFFTKTAMLLAVVLALTQWNLGRLFGSVCCACNAILMTAAIYSILQDTNRKQYYKRNWCACGFWIGAMAAVMFLFGDKLYFGVLLVCNSVLAFLILWSADAYSFYKEENLLTQWHEIDSKMIFLYRYRKRSLQNICYLWRYLFRYLKAHRNYFWNTVILWGVACVLPSFLGALDGAFVFPIGFAILSLNTPLCILLSCDSALEQAVHVLPKQKWSFCVPYGLFIFLWNGIANSLFLCSWQIQIGGITGLTILAAIFFALQSAIFSVLLEWFYPIRGWKIESDLWHHPRKYLVPAGMLLLAGVVKTAPVVTIILLGIEAAVVKYGMIKLSCR